MNKLELATAIMGTQRVERSASSRSTTSTIKGVATTDSSDGVVYVDLGGDVVSQDDEQGVPVATTADVREGDQVVVTLSGADGTAKGVTVTGVPGGGDRTKAEVDAVKLTADTATEKLAEAVEQLGDLEEVVDSKADAKTTLSDGTEVEITTQVSQNAADIATKAAATITLDSGESVDLATQVKQDATSVSTLVTDVDGISTLIRDTTDGVEVGKSEDGTTFTTNRTVQGDGSFKILSKDGTELSYWDDDEIKLGENSASSKVSMCGDTATVVSQGTSTDYGIIVAVKDKDGRNSCSSALGILDTNGDADDSCVAIQKTGSAGETTAVIQATNISLIGTNLVLTGASSTYTISIDNLIKAIKAALA